MARQYRKPPLNEGHFGQIELTLRAAGYIRDMYHGPEEKVLTFKRIQMFL